MRRFLVPLVVVAVLGALAATALAATRSVKVGDNWFVRPGSPVTVAIRKGSSVKWEWVGRRPHNVTANAGPARFHSRTQRRGTFTKRFTRRGLYTIVCTIHPGMEMKVRVK